MSEIYEEYHQIIAQLVAGEPAVAGEAVDVEHRLAPHDARRDAFIRVMQEELALLRRA